MKDHEEYQESIGAYLLGALPELEAEVFERHVMGCAACREELERLRPAAEALPRAVPQLAAPPGLKEAIMADVRGPAPARRRLSRLRLPGMRLPILRPATAWVSAAVILLAGLAAGYGIGALSDDGDPRVVAAEVDRSRLPGAAATLLAPDDDGAAVLSAQGLARDQVYVVWVKRGDEVIYESSFNARPDGSAKAAIESIEGVDSVMVTRERSTAVSAPGEAPVIAVSTD